jgi:sporulation protein YlmC with PRC-barrel domain
LFLKEEIKMKKTLIFVAMFSLLSLGLVTYPYGAEPMASSAYRSYETDALFGQSIFNQEGQNLGSLNDFVVDTNGHILLAIIHHGPYDYSSMMESGGVYTAVPFSSLVISGIQPYQEVNLNLDREKLASAPGFEMEKLMDRQWAVDAYKFYGLQPTWPGTGEETTLQGLLRKPVNDPDGMYLGTISNFVLDVNSGNVLFAVIQQGTRGGLRRDAIYKAIPFTSLALSGMKSNEALVTKIDENKLKLAPNFDSGSAMDSNWARDNYRYFGEQPYWTEEESGSVPSPSRGRPDYFTTY